MFVAFWLSFIGLVFTATSIASVTYNSDILRNVNFFYGTVSVDYQSYKANFDYFAGIRMIYVDIPSNITNKYDINRDIKYSDCSGTIIDVSDMII